MKKIIKSRIVTTCTAETTSASASFSVNLSLMNKCSISQRTEVQLQASCTGNYPFRVATFNVLVS